MHFLALQMFIPKLSRILSHRCLLFSSRVYRHGRRGFIDESIDRLPYENLSFNIFPTIRSTFCAMQMRENYKRKRKIFHPLKRKERLFEDTFYANGRVSYADAFLVNFAERRKVKKVAFVELRDITSSNKGIGPSKGWIWQWSRSIGARYKVSKLL